nr:uncharacterized protein LOC107279635 [Oryza sativa Japonica Group]
MAEKQAPPPSSPGSVKGKVSKPGLTDIIDDNVMPIDPEKFTPEQRQEFEATMQQVRDQYLSSFMQTRKGTLVQKYKIKVVADSPGTGSSKDGEVKQAPDGSAQPTNKGATDGSIGNQGDNPQGVHGAPGQPMNPRLLMREHPQPTGQTANQPTQDQVAAMFLPPPPIVDPVQQQPIQQTPPIQPVVQPIQQTPVRQQIVQPIPHPGSANASAGFAAPGGQPAQQFVNQIVPEHLVHHAQPDGTVVPQMVPEHLVRNIQSNLHNYQGGNLSYQYQPPSPQAQYQPGGSAQQQFAPQFGQFEPVQQQPQGAAQQRP